MAQRRQRLIEAAKQPLPVGTFAVGAGLMVAGVTTYGFQILGFRALSKPDYAALNALWVFVFVLAPGIFLPLEQEVGRAIAARRARGIGGGPVARRAGVLGLAFALALAVITIAVAIFTPIVNNLFAGNAGLIACLVISLFTYGFELLARGVFAGTSRFKRVRDQHGRRGHHPPPAGHRARRGRESRTRSGTGCASRSRRCSPPWWRCADSTTCSRPGPTPRGPSCRPTSATCCSARCSRRCLSYAPFLGAQVLATSGQRAAVADFIVGLFLSRIPILLFQAVQAVLLPGLAAMVSSGRHDEFRTGVRNLVFVVVGIGLVGVVAAATAGPFVGKLLFGSKFQLGNIDLALLAAGSGLFILALTLAQALIALLGHARAMMAWFTGIVVFTVVTILAGPQLFLRVEIGSIAGAGAAAGVMALQLYLQLRRGVGEGSLAALVDQIETEPLEI